MPSLGIAPLVTQQAPHFATMMHGAAGGKSIKRAIIAQNYRLRRGWSDANCAPGATRPPPSSKGCAETREYQARPPFGTCSYKHHLYWCTSSLLDIDYLIRRVRERPPQPTPDKPIVDI